jgi:MarR family transcriptional regulator, organic hydroperoxide resistance regulator
MQNSDNTIQRNLPESGPTGISSGTATGERLRVAYWRALHDLEALRLQQWERSNLTLPQLRVLFQVRRSPGITTGQLAKGMRITMSTTSGLVTKLADRGLLTRCISQDDRRQIPLELSEAGVQLAGELAETTRPFLDSVVAELGDDLERVAEALELLGQVTARVRARESVASEGRALEGGAR